MGREERMWEKWEEREKYGRDRIRAVLSLVYNGGWA